MNLRPHDHTLPHDEELTTYLVEQSEQDSMHCTTMQQLIQAEIGTVWLSWQSERRPRVAGALIQPLLPHTVHTNKALFYVIQ